MIRAIALAAMRFAAREDASATALSWPAATERQRAVAAGEFVGLRLERVAARVLSTLRAQ